MSEPRQCRECGVWGTNDDIKVYDVVLDDGEYPNTPLCALCAEALGDDLAPQED